MPAGLTLDRPAPAGLAVLDRYLNAPDRAPVAVAVSGGGDSLALLHAAVAWRALSGRPLIALHVDHRLQPGSGAWRDFAAGRAARLGVSFRSLGWDGVKPAAGLPAAARAARHALLAEAARTAGARVILMGHSADDLAEAAEMRASGSTAPSPRIWAPSPAWPEGRGVFLLRPLLGARRGDLRQWLAEAGESWIDDPANEDLRYARAAARRRLSSRPDPLPAPPSDRAPPDALGLVEEGLGGELSLPRAALRGEDPDAERLLSALLLCASGGARPPRSDRLRRLISRLEMSGTFAATLAGARIDAQASRVAVMCEPGEFVRRGIGPGPLRLGESVFDGRFEIVARDGGLTISPLAGFAKRLPKAQQARLRHIPAGARGALPLTISPDGHHSCPIVAQSGDVCARPLGLERLRAAMGAFPDEAAIWRVAKSNGGA